MAMTVRQLIAELRKMPADAKVCFIAHDQDPERGEYDGAAHYVEEAPPALAERGFGAFIA